MKPQKPIVCRKCIFYYITWDTRRPHGCRAMNFKSRRPPSLVVRQSSGQDCLHYTLKDETGDRDL
ncbi:uracil-DNA glycosylase [uncultured Desulfosarcina sp.]|uniref:uracil-DNA glycosylase n=1 Tax=uncultured Desulfosarcina sp. TaxID=218289 RepID=UPI0029C746BF|nr:uracil-DNA glycosylase [uncultured Desulfosarcina sp.]